METIVSGVRPTGHLHIGNYFGAVRNFVRMQEDYPCYFFIADYHSLTTHPKPEDLHHQTKQVLIEYLACGLDPEKTVLYVQSDIPEIPQLFLIMNMLAYKGELERSTTFKDKAAKQEKNINAGLLTYPVLMAVDIIIHRATKVPVGKDQEQHLEMTRNFANRFNHMYGVDYFPEPVAFNFKEKLVKIRGLDGSGKMGKSEGPHNAIFLAEEPNKMKKKIMRAKTDTGPTEPNSPMTEEIENLFNLLDLVSKPEIVTQFRDAYADCTIRYGDLKKQLAEDMIAFTDPIRDKIAELESKPDYLSEVLAEGARKARESASKTLSDVKEIIGIRGF